MPRRTSGSELALWEKIQKSTDPTAFEEYLRRYPSGNFSELAQLALDRVLAKQGEKKVEVVAAEANPYSKGSAVMNTGYKVGETYVFRRIDLRTNREDVATTTVTNVTDTQVTFNNGNVIDHLGNNFRNPEGITFSPNQLVPLEYVVGKQWTTRYMTSGAGRGIDTNEGHFKIVAREMVTVGAGTFNAFRVESVTQAWGGGPPVTVTMTRWFAPDKVRLPIRSDLSRVIGGSTVTARRAELLSFKEP